VLSIDLATGRAAHVTAHHIVSLSAIGQGLRIESCCHGSTHVLLHSHSGGGPCAGGRCGRVTHAWDASISAARTAHSSIGAGGRVGLALGRYECGSCMRTTATSREEAAARADDLVFTCLNCNKSAPVENVCKA
jgi:hypothetical protein